MLQVYKKKLNETNTYFYEILLTPLIFYYLSIYHESHVRLEREYNLSNVYMLPPSLFMRDTDKERSQFLSV